MVSNRASRYRHTVELLTPVVAQGDDGSAITRWELVAVFRADVMPSAGSESVIGGKLTAEANYTAALRYRAGVTITPAMRLRSVALGKTWEIVSVKADDTFRRDFVLALVEKVL